MKNNLSYYRHETSAHNHWKFKTLRREYANRFGKDGWAGEGKFWALNNLIADAPNCELDLSYADKKRAIAIDLDFSLPEFELFLEILTSVCNLVQISNNALITGITQECFTEVSSKRKYQREWKKEKSNIENNISISTSRKLIIENEQIKEKKKKEKESKEETHAPVLDVNDDGWHTKPETDFRTKGGLEENWNTRPGEESLNLELPEIKKGAVIELLRISKNTTVTAVQVNSLWNVFKAQWFDGNKFYQRPSDVFTHFINWCSKKDIKDIPKEETILKPADDWRQEKADRILNAK